MRLAILTAVLLIAPPVPAATIRVPDDEPTIQEGIGAAAPGDTVEVACGTYYESELDPSGVVLISASGQPDCVTIDAQGEVASVIRTSGPSASTIVGVTLTNGEHGIACEGPGPVQLSRCVLRENSAVRGAGLEVTTLSPVTVEDCFFLLNHATAYGGAAFCTGKSTTFSRCVFSDNSAANTAGGVYCTSESLAFEDCAFQRNTSVYAGGVFARNPVTVLRCQFIENAATSEGGAFYDQANAGSVIDQCTFFGNQAGEGSGIYTLQSAITVEHTIIQAGIEGAALSCGMGSSATLMCCDVWGNDGGDWNGCIGGQLGLNGNFSANARFCDAGGGDFMLAGISPCLPGNHPDGFSCGLIGALPLGCRPVHLVPTTWGSIKARYR